MKRKNVFVYNPQNTRMKFCDFIHRIIQFLLVVLYKVVKETMWTYVNT
ncbi:hypothetical protein HMPREF3214_00912 [Alloscardovia omnicolens]|nr:hypothetical protein HMPREF3214_00912 [Alloscardovia omnicolens]